jgi:nitrite reductase/ring-hydroxylating ferredoxin subunit
MEWQRVCAEADITDGSMCSFQIGETHLVVCRTGGELHAFNGICPHRGAMLGQGTLDGQAVICPWHNWEFDVTTGKGVTNEQSSIPVYPVRVENGDIFVGL